jgi:predicted nuclease of restriction endonuclease-like (RecB) superfamily
MNTQIVDSIAQLIKFLHEEDHSLLRGKTTQEHFYVNLVFYHFLEKLFD